jgi:hypothetical protein
MNERNEMANFVTVKDNQVICHWVCRECSEYVHVHPYFHMESGNPVCPECDEEMEYKETLVDDSVNLEG